MNIPDDMINSVLGSDAGDVSKAPNKLEVVCLTLQCSGNRATHHRQGPASRACGYIYDMVGRKERTEILKSEISNFNKETKDWDTQSKTATDMTNKLDRIESILNKNPNVVGPQFGLSNDYIPDRSSDARELDGLFKGIQLHSSVPQGQGAVSNMERDLFSLASPNMNNDAKTNKNLIGIQREIFAPDKDRRDFFSQCFNEYKSTNNGDMVAAWDRYINSPAGAAFTRDPAGNPVP